MRNRSSNKMFGTKVELNVVCDAICDVNLNCNIDALNIVLELSGPIVARMPEFDACRPLSVLTA